MVADSKQSNSGNAAPAEDRRGRTTWFDLSNIIESCGSTNGGIRTELEFASALMNFDPETRFALRVKDGYGEVTRDQLSWLLERENALQGYVEHFCGEKKDAYPLDGDFVPRKHAITVRVSKRENLPCPFETNDLLITMGWRDAEKEAVLSRIKARHSGIILGQAVHNTYLLTEEAILSSPKNERKRFKRHLKWVFNECDFALVFSDYALTNLANVQVEMGWPPLACIVVPRGSHKPHSANEFEDIETLDKYDLHGPFAMVIGNPGAHENCDTIYRACRMALMRDPQSIGKILFCGESFLDSANDLPAILDRDPVVKGKVIHLRPSSSELQLLCKRCLFIVVPSGSQSAVDLMMKNATLAKSTLAADFPSLRSIAANSVSFVSPYDAREWSIAITNYFAKESGSSPQAAGGLAPGADWHESVEQMHHQLKEILAPRICKKLPPEIWFDVSTSYLYWEGGVAGIIRTELTFAKYLYELVAHDFSIHFFAWSHNCFFEVAAERLQWLFDSDDLVRDYEWFHEFWKNHSIKRDIFSEGNPSADDPRVIQCFPDNSIVLFTCIDWNMKESRVKAATEMKAKGNGILLSQLIYDMTPFLVPHLHAEATCKGYQPFVEYVSNNFDHLIFGGKTCKRDAIKIQEENTWRTPLSDYIEFGSDIQSKTSSALDQVILQKYSVMGPFILTVGTLEPRKNHEMLYRAYLHMISIGKGVDMPLLVIVGKKGWRIDDFLSLLREDARVKGKIIIVSPSDMELDVLYRNCLFTVLASFYEGWSLTLPESLSYGKFCLTSRVDPLLETGGDLVEYVDPLDTAEWGRRMHFYSNNLSALKARETYIARAWKPKSWREATTSLLKLVYSAHDTCFPSSSRF